MEAEKEELEVGDVRLRAFDHDDSVVSILEDGDPGATGKVGSNPTNMASGFRLIQNGGKRVHDHIEQERGEGVALSNPTKGGEERANLTVDVHSRATTRDHLNDSSDPPVIEALPKTDFPEEGPANRIIGLVEINLQKNHLKVFDTDLMKDFMKDKDPIQDVTTLNVGRLVGVSHTVSQQGHPIGVPFSQNLEDHVNHRDWAELTNVRGTRNLGDERDRP